VALPSALDPDFLASLRGRQLLVGLDFDGTLAPIAPRPELAAMPSATRQVLERLRGLHRIAVISGRGLNDVRAHVNVEGLVYGGCHGMQIEGPELSFAHDEATVHLPVLRAAKEELCAELGDVKGILIEDKGLAVAVHRRNVAVGDHGRIESAVDRALRSGLRRKRGKMIDEVVPDVAWDKGRALLWLREALGSELPALYLGDDVTDEDAFRVLKGEDVGVLVSERPRETAAARGLVDSEAVRTFLEALAAPGTRQSAR